MADENWIQKNWHPLCGIVYLTICLSDFVVMPSYYEYLNAQLTPDKLVVLATKFPDATSQIAALQTLKVQRSWQPITLAQNGFLHIAFGSILGVGIWAKGRANSGDLPNQIQQAIASGLNSNSATTTTATSTS